MFSCPTEDLHSVYLDNELPDEFISQYENHIFSCADCQKELEKLRKVKELLQSDANSIRTDSLFMEQSFGRLMTKMRYSKNTSFIHKEKKNVMPYLAGLAAAVAFALIVPLGVKTQKSNDSVSTPAISQITPIERPQNPSISNKRLVINGNIDDNLAHSVSSGNFENPRFADVDVFRPEFRQMIPFHCPIDAPEFGIPRGRPPVYPMQRSLQFPVTNIQDYNRE